MGQSNNIKDFFSVEFKVLRENSTIPFDIHLYFSQNDHLILWRRKETQITPDFLKKYEEAGVQLIWISTQQKKEYQTYLLGEPSAAESPAAEPPMPQTEEGAFLAEVMNSENLSENEKSAVVSEAAKEILSELVSVTDPEEQKRANEKAKNVVRDILSQTQSEVQAATEEILQLLDLDPDLQHSANVSVYAVLFSMAFGKSDPALLSDLSTAGLFHDLGLALVDASITAKDWKNFSEKDLSTYRKHPEFSVQLLKRHFQDASERVHQFILQSHEKFDGTGYPHGLQGFDLDDAGQLIAMAEFLDSIASGQWDGKRRTFHEAIQTLDQMEALSNFPESFNPDVFSQVRRWIKSGPDHEETAQVMESPKGKMETLLRK